MPTRIDGRAAPTDIEAYRFDEPGPDQGADIRRLIEACRPLDVNSTYAYLLLCHHFAATCVVAARRDEGAGPGQEVPIAGFVSAYRPPGTDDLLFVWQVAVHPRHRGRGLGQAMLRELLGRPALAKVRRLETTVTPSNLASSGMFHSLASWLGARCEQRSLFERSHFGNTDHEEEVLLSIGPFLRDGAAAPKNPVFHPARKTANESADI